MADNALGALFSDIASAIREKSGMNVPMKPIDFPENILSIPVGTGGGSSGDSGNSGSSGVVGSGLKMASGTFTPDTMTKLFSDTLPFARNQTWTDYYYWEASPAPFVPTSGTEYNIWFYGDMGLKRRTAKTVRSIAGMADCVVLGNEEMLDGTLGDNFLIIYSESADKLLCFTPLHKPKIALEIHKSKSERLTIEHGLGVMPDLVMVYYNSMFISYESAVIAAWGLKSTFAEYTDVLGAVTGEGYCLNNYVYGIDNLPELYQSDGYIYCPDENTFQIGETADSTLPGKLVDGANYTWIAIAGLGSGGSMEGVHTVTFMSEDGQTELFKRPVADGDNCADPVARGLLDAPTKESTNTQTFVHAGWSATPSGSADASILNAVTEDKTVYAAFTASARYYTIRFFDGNTLLKTVYAEYGSTPSYTPTKDNYAFFGWAPEITAATGDADYHAQWVESVTFADASWAKIAEIAESGNAATMFALGDTKSVPLTLADGTKVNVTFEIVGFNHDDLADGTGKAGISIVSKYALDVTSFTGLSIYSFVYYITDNSWHISSVSGDIKTKFCDVYLAAMPTELTQHIKTVTKLTQQDKSTTVLQESANDLWVPSCTEAFNNHNVSDAWGKAVGGQGTQYALYAKGNNYLKKYPQDKTGVSTTFVEYGLRSPVNNYVGNAGVFTINTSGVGDFSTTPTHYPIGFCI